jgi:membrane glycosyltransferase
MKQQYANKFYKAIILSFLLFLSGSVLAQDSIDYEKYIDDSSVNQQHNTPQKTTHSFSDEIDKATRSRVFQDIDQYNKEKFMKAPEFIICILLISFAVLISMLQVVLFLKGKLSSFQIGRLMMITLIIFSILFLIAAGYSNDQIAPAIGLLGTIAGYLLGKSSNPNNKNSNT